MLYSSQIQMFLLGGIIVDNPAEDLQQPYDTFVKALFRGEMDSLVSYFLKGATLRLVASDEKPHS